MIGVVDTSALMRLVIPDGPVPVGFEAFMRGVERGEHAALAPHLLLAEAGSVVLRKVRAGQLAPDEGRAIVALIDRFPIRLAAHGPLLGAALDTGQRQSLSFYDALYLALARACGARLFTADQRLAAAAARLGFA